MKNINILTALSLFLVCIPSRTFAQKTSQVEDYNRSSLYTFTILHKNDSMYKQMYKTMISLPNPEKYNDHNLSLRILHSDGSRKEIASTEQITSFINRNEIAKRLVAKWFNRDEVNGSFNIDLVAERGNYNATVEDVEEASMNIRGLSLLDDAGEQLIPNTFVLVNEITYVNKEEKAQKTKKIASIISTVASFVPVTGASIISDIADMTSDISDMIAGFRIDIKTSLYRLKWNDEIAQQFYTLYYYDKNHIDPAKKAAFENDHSLFTMEYIGEYSARSAETVMRGLYNDEAVFTKVLARAIDENIVELQKKFDVFKVVSSVYEADDKTVKVHIGMKEGVSEDSQYEVLERTINKDGKISYKRVAVIKPIKGKIWDNRCMAYEERSEGSNLTATSFKITSGGDLYPGLIVKEFDSKSGSSADSKAKASKDKKSKDKESKAESKKSSKDKESKAESKKASKGKDSKSKEAKASKDKKTKSKSKSK